MRSRATPITARQLRILLDHKRHQSLNKSKWVTDLDLIFPNPIGKMLDESRDKKWMKRICEKALVPRYSLYQFRKTAFTELLISSDAGTTMAFSGHSQASTLFKHYITPEEAAVRRAIEKREIANTAIQSDVTGTARGMISIPSTAAASFTLGTLDHFYAGQGSIGAGSAITVQAGFKAANTLAGATYNYGFLGDVVAGTNNYNLYMNGTADNYLAGALGVGTTSLTGYNFQISRNITGATTAFGMGNFGQIQSDVTTEARYFSTAPSTAATAFTLADLRHYAAFQGTFGAGSAVTTQVLFYAGVNATGATNNYAFFGGLTAATGRYNLYMSGTAANYFGGDMQFNKTVTAGGTTGAQTISKNAGTVNFAAAATSLVVTNTLVTTSSIIICTVGTNDTTMKSALAVAAAGSFTIHSNAAATAETRVNFIVIN